MSPSFSFVGTKQPGLLGRPVPVIVHLGSATGVVARSGWYQTTTVLAFSPLIVPITVESTRTVVLSRYDAMLGKSGTLTAIQSVIAQLPGQAPTPERATDAATDCESAGTSVVPTSLPEAAEVAGANGFPFLSVVRAVATPAGT